MSEWKVTTDMMKTIHIQDELQIMVYLKGKKRFGPCPIAELTLLTEEIEGEYMIFEPFTQILHDANPQNAPLAALKATKEKLLQWVQEIGLEIRKLEL